MIEFLNWWTESWWRIIFVLILLTGVYEILYILAQAVWRFAGRRKENQPK